MACMEHVCVNMECDAELIFNNKSHMDCPECGEPMTGFFDEEPDHFDYSEDTRDVTDYY